MDELRQHAQEHANQKGLCKILSLLIEIRDNDNYNDLRRREEAFNLCTQRSPHTEGMNLFIYASFLKNSKFLQEILQLSKPDICGSGEHLSPVLQDILETVIQKRDTESFKHVLMCGVFTAGSFVTDAKKGATSIAEVTVLMKVIQVEDSGELVACCLQYSKAFDINHANSRGHTALMVTCSTNHPIDNNVLHQLLHFNRLIKVDSQSTAGHITQNDAVGRPGVTALMIAVDRGAKYAIQELLGRGANITIQDRDNQTVFWYAVKKMNLEILHTLILAAFQMRIYTFPSRQISQSMYNSCLIWAIDHREVGVIYQVLSRPRFASRSTTLYGDSSSSESEPDSDMDKSSTKSNLRALVNTFGTGGISAMMVAAMCNSYKLCKFLLPHANLRHQDSRGMNALMHAVDNDSHQVTPHLLEKMLQIDDALSKPTQLSSADGSETNGLLETRKSLTMVNRERQNILLVAVEVGNLAFVRQLLDDPRASFLNLNHRDRDKNFLLLKILQHARHSNERLREGWVALVRLLLQNYDVDINLHGPRGRTILMEAYLINHPIANDGSLVTVSGLEFNARDKAGRTALNFLIQNGAVEGAHLLLRTAPTPNIACNIADYLKTTPLHSCVQLAYTMNKKTLSKDSSRNNNSFQRTSTFSPRQKNRKQLMSFIESLVMYSHTSSASSRYLCDLNIQNKIGETAFVMAIKLGQDDIAELLLKIALDRLNINVADDDGATPLMHAITNQMTYISLKLLSQESLDVSVVDREGNGVLNYLMIHHRVDEALMLLKRDGFVLHNDTAFLWAIENVYDNIFYELVALPNASELLTSLEPLELLLLNAISQDEAANVSRRAKLEKMFCAAAKIVERRQIAKVVLKVLTLAIEHDTMELDDQVHMSANDASRKSDNIEHAHKQKLALIGGMSTAISAGVIRGKLSGDDLPSSMVSCFFSFCVRTRALEMLPRKDVKAMVEAVFQLPVAIAHFNRPSALARLQQDCAQNMNAINEDLATMIRTHTGGLMRCVDGLSLRKKHIAVVQGGLRQDCFYNKVQIMQNEDGRGLHDITYIHMLSLIATTLKKQFHNDMHTLVQDAKLSLIECLTSQNQGHATNDNSDIHSANNLDPDAQSRTQKNNLNAFLERVQYRTARNKSNARMLERLEQWQQQNITIAVAESQNTTAAASVPIPIPLSEKSPKLKRFKVKRKRSKKKQSKRLSPRSKKHKFPLSAKNVDVLRCSLVVPVDNVNTCMFLDEFIKLLHKKSPVVRFKNEYNGLARELVQDTPAPFGLWNRCISLNFIYRPRRAGRKLVKQCTTYAQMMQEPAVQQSFKSYVDPLSKGGQDIANAAIKFLESDSIANETVGMICELQIILKPFLDSGRILSHPYRAIIGSHDALDMALRLDRKAVVKQQQRIASLETEETPVPVEKEIATECMPSSKSSNSQKKDTLVEASQSLSSSSSLASSSPPSSTMGFLSMSVTFVMKLAQRAKKRRLELEREMLLQLKRKKEAHNAALEGRSKLPVRAPMPYHRPKLFSRNVSYPSSTFSDVQYPWNQRQKQIHIPRRGPSLKKLVRINMRDLALNSDFDSLHTNDFETDQNSDDSSYFPVTSPKQHKSDVSDHRNTKNYVDDDLGIVFYNDDRNPTQRTLDEVLPNPPVDKSKHEYRTRTARQYMENMRKQYRAQTTSLRNTTHSRHLQASSIAKVGSQVHLHAALVREAPLQTLLGMYFIFFGQSYKNYANYYTAYRMIHQFKYTYLSITIQYV